MSAADGAGGYKACRIALAKAEARVDELESVAVEAVREWMTAKHIEEEDKIGALHREILGEAWITPGSIR